MLVRKVAQVEGSIRRLGLVGVGEGRESRVDGEDGS